MATTEGMLPTVIVAITLFVAVLMTDTLLEPLLGTYTRLPSGVTARSIGVVPTMIVATTKLVLVLMTLTVVPLTFETYTY